MSSSAVGFPQKSHLRLLSSSDCQFLYFRLCLITNIIRWNKLLSRSAPCVPNPPGQGGYQTLNLSSQYPVLCSAVDNCWANKITPPIQSVSRPIYKFSQILLSRRRFAIIWNKPKMQKVLTKYFIRILFYKVSFPRSSTYQAMDKTTIFLFILILRNILSNILN